MGLQDFHVCSFDEFTRIQRIFTCNTGVPSEIMSWTLYLYNDNVELLSILQFQKQKREFFELLGRR